MESKGSKLKVILRGGEVAKDLVAVELDGHPVFCDHINIDISPTRVKAVITILDVELEYEGPTETKHKKI